MSACMCALPTEPPPTVTACSCAVGRHVGGALRCRTRGIPGYTGRQPKVVNNAACQQGGASSSSSGCGNGSGSGHHSSAPPHPVSCPAASFPLGEPLSQAPSDAPQQPCRHGAGGAEGGAAPSCAHTAQPALHVPAPQQMLRGLEGKDREGWGRPGGRAQLQQQQGPGGRSGRAEWWAAAASQQGGGERSGIELAQVGDPQRHQEQWRQEQQGAAAAAAPGAAAGSPVRAQGPTTYGAAYAASPEHSRAGGWQAAARQLPWGSPATAARASPGHYDGAGSARVRTEWEARPGTAPTAGVGAAGSGLAGLPYAAADMRYSAYGGVRNSTCNL